MNIMFLLIPALLLAMETASMAGVAISPPHFCQGESAPDEPPAADKLDLAVVILADGFRVSSAAQQQGAEIGRAQDSSSPTIPLAKPGASAADYSRYDYAALEQLARDLKHKYPHEAKVRVSAENDIPAQVLISTLDALRGTDCSLRGASSADELATQCLFFQPVVEAGH